MARFRPNPGYPLIDVTRQSFDALEELITWAEMEAPSKVPFWMNQLAQRMALINQGMARKMAFGPSDPRGRNTDLAWRTPSQGIRRITGSYYVRWQVRRRGLGTWVLINDSREAYYIEFGISRVGFSGTRSVPARRIRRPVQKLSFRKTLEYAMRTRTFHRVWASIMIDPRYKGRGMGFSQFIQPSSDSHSHFNAWEGLEGMDVGNKSGGINYSGPILGRKLP